MSSLAQVLPERYGYVVLAVAGGSLVNIYHIVQVAKARKQYSVKVSVLEIIIVIFLSDSKVCC